MTASVQRAGAVAGELARMLATLLWVVGAAAVAIGALGALPAFVAGEAGVARVASLDAAEKLLGARVLLPAYFPDRLAWPPAEVRVAGGRGGAVALAFDARGGGRTFELFQAVEDGDDVPEDLLGERSVLREGRTTVGSLPARLATVVAGGATWQELSWRVGGRALVLRGPPGDPDLFRIAHSAHREHAR
jgi:hypothetical protein